MNNIKSSPLDLTEHSKGKRDLNFDYLWMKKSNRGRTVALRSRELEQSGSPAPAARVAPSEQLWLRSYREGASMSRAVAQRDSASVERSKLLAALPLRQPDGFGEWGIGDLGVGRPDGPLGRPARCGLWAAFS